MKKFILFTALLMAAAYLSGCESEDNTTPSAPHTSPHGALIGHSDCKSSIDTNSSDQGKRNKAGAIEDCMEYGYEGDTLRLKHINAAFNCCPKEILVETRILSDTLIIVESEAASLCDCLCLYDLDIAVYALPAGKYTIVVKEPYIPEGEPPLAFDVDLTAAPAGKYCVKRSRYPW